MKGKSFSDNATSPTILHGLPGSLGHGVWNVQHGLEGPWVWTLPASAPSRLLPAELLPIPRKHNTSSSHKDFAHAVPSALGYLATFSLHTPLPHTHMSIHVFSPQILAQESPHQRTLSSLTTQLSTSIKLTKSTQDPLPYRSSSFLEYIIAVSPMCSRVMASSSCIPE